MRPQGVGAKDEIEGGADFSGRELYVEKKRECEREKEEGASMRGY
jgi:hypothetical protein